ncbi:hypothetical protein CRUP_017778 [Coryphaenoides rupestris]|nr:hypothetical protein CRUP_017778 [Coryphaenoides rupestris]
MCIEVTAESKVVFISETLCIGAGICVKGPIGEIIARKDETNTRESVCEQLGLTHLLDRHVENLSGGELQRFACAVVCIQKADIFMFDEPSSYLDVKQRLKAATAIRTLITPFRYIIVVEHDLSVLDFLSDFICCLYGVPSAYGVVTMPFSVREDEVAEVWPRPSGAVVPPAAPPPPPLLRPAPSSPVRGPDSGLIHCSMTTLGPGPPTGAYSACLWKRAGELPWGAAAAVVMATMESWGWGSETHWRRRRQHLRHVVQRRVHEEDWSGQTLVTLAAGGGDAELEPGRQRARVVGLREPGARGGVARRGRLLPRHLLCDGLTVWQDASSLVGGVGWRGQGVPRGAHREAGVQEVLEELGHLLQRHRPLAGFWPGGGAEGILGGEGIRKKRRGLEVGEGGVWGPCHGLGACRRQTGYRVGRLELRKWAPPGGGATGATKTGAEEGEVVVRSGEGVLRSAVGGATAAAVPGGQEVL